MNKEELNKFVRRNLLVVISGPSGAGKSTVTKSVMETPGPRETMELSVSATTRKPRPGETDGVHYKFMSGESFEAMKNAGGFLEWAHVHGAEYGTPRANIDDAHAKGLDLLLEIDVQGALQVKASHKDAILIFIAAPLDVLRKRLLARPSNLDPVQLENEISFRLRNALSELKAIPEYDYLVLNEKLDECVNSVISIIMAERRRIVSSCGGCSRF
jgi:guanylate kinase